MSSFTASAAVSSQAASTQASLVASFTKMNAQAERGMADMLMAAAETLKAALPAGVGQGVDLSL